MNKEFIPYEQALELKELGFNEICSFYYKNKVIDDCINAPKTNSVGEFISENFECTAPLYQQAFRWFREKHTYQCYIQFMNNSYAYWIGIKSIDFYYHSFNSTPRDMKIDSSWETYEEAELACLKKLIEIAKNK